MRAWFVAISLGLLVASCGDDDSRNVGELCEFLCACDAAGDVGDKDGDCQVECEGQASAASDACFSCLDAIDTCEEQETCDQVCAGTPG